MTDATELAALADSAIAQAVRDLIADEEYCAHFDETFFGTIISLAKRTAANKAEPTDEAIEDFLADRMTPEGRVPMIKTIREALVKFCPGCFDCAYNGDLCDRHQVRALASRDGGWLPIESAPKHRDVLVWREDTYPFIAKLTVPEEVIPEDRLGEMEFPDDFEEWWSDAYGWQEGSEKPTHWQPLPNPPAAPEPVAVG